MSNICLKLSITPTRNLVSLRRDLPLTADLAWAFTELGNNREVFSKHNKHTTQLTIFMQEQWLGIKSSKKILKVRKCLLITLYLALKQLFEIHRYLPKWQIGLLPN